MATLILSAFILLAQPSYAFIISNSGEEVTYTYEFEFRSLERRNSNKNLDAKELANFHAIHLYGIFHSADYLYDYGLSPDLYEGFAGTHYPEIDSAKIITKNDDPYLWVRYSAKGKMLVLKPVLKKWLGNKRSGSVTLPLIAELTLVYLDDMSGYRRNSFKKCTDPSHTETADFSYFYTPFACPELSTPPIAKNVEFKITRVDPNMAASTRVPLAQLRADNGNGNLTVLYFTYGFDQYLESGTSPDKIRKDEAWKLYKSIHKTLENSYGFQKIESTAEYRSALGHHADTIQLLTPVTMEHDTQRRYFSTHVKHDGKNIIVVRSALFDTSNSTGASPLLSFPKFWKEAWENGDFIYYGGHSEDGASLSMVNMLSNLSHDEIKNVQFKTNKTQVAFIDACSSYAHFLDMYKSLKSKNLHFISYGVVSLFHLAETTVNSTLALLLDGPVNITWQTALKNVEMSQLAPQIEYYFGKKLAPSIIKEYEELGEYPQMLLNVSVPD
ncbi:MAG: hypothetical protein KDD38_00455 [Bdellovibrionales bacterium]|nr:hypothetical protein [Bdellovibrionales bacterium]